VIEVEQLARDEDGAWDAFLRTRPDALLYHSSWYRDLIAEELIGVPEYLVAREGGEIRGGLPMIWSSGEGTSDRVLNSLALSTQRVVGKQPDNRRHVVASCGSHCDRKGRGH